MQIRKLNGDLEKLTERYGSQVKVLLTDVRHSAQILHLIPDGFELKEPRKKKKSEPQDIEKSRITVRMMDFGKVYDSSTQKTINLTDLEDDKELVDKMEANQQNLFHLKFKPEMTNDGSVSLSDQLIDFVEKCLSNNLKPHLESDQAGDLKHQIPTLSLG